MLRAIPHPVDQLAQGSTLLFFLALVATSWGQTGPPSSRKGGPGDERGPKPKLVTLFGVVQDAETQEALPFASVVVVSARDSSVLDGVLSSEEGAFRMEKVEVGRLLLEVRFPGYQTQRVGPRMCTPRNPESLKWDVGTLQLEPEITALNEALVVEQASVMEMRVDRRVFHVGNDLTSRGGNTTELLENIPSVQVDIDGNITLRGSSGVQILIDGRPSGLSGGAREAFLESLPASAVERVELITNPSARFDPDALPAPSSPHRSPLSLAASP